MRGVLGRLFATGSLIAVAWVDPALGSTTTTTFQPAGSSVDDSHVREDNVTEQNGTKPDLRVKASGDQHDRNTLVSIPFTGMTNRTILRAWLELQQTAAASATAVDARIYPLTESWNESIVTWATRDRVLLLNQPWTTPGGTRSAYWTDRAIVSSATNGGAVRWSVGPIVQAWNTGSIANDGFLIEPVRGGAEREIVFASSDNGTATLRPRLIIQSTDEPPAIATGTAEIQPRSVRVGSKNVPLTIWLDVDAQGATPSGTATGFDALFLAHGGGLLVQGVDRFVVGGASISPSLVTWSDDGQTVTFRFPRVQVHGQVQLDIRADVLSPAVGQGLALPMSVDDTTTPGASAQDLWPGNADRVAGNGDDWILSVLDTPPVSIDLTPDAASMTNRTCLALSASGRDSLGNVFSLVPDSVRVVPSSSGSMGGPLSFCATSAGTTRLIACYGALRDTSTITVQPEKLTQVASLVLKTTTGALAAAFAPADTMFLDATYSDGDGAKDVHQLDFVLRHPLAASVPGSPAYGATFRWTRNASPAWTLVQPAATTWAIVPSRCSLDSTSNTTGQITARLAFVAGHVARASAAGEWSATVNAVSDTPVDTATAAQTGINVPVRFTVHTADTLAAFGAAPPGTSGLPLETPADAHLHFSLEANTAYRLETMGTNLIGQLSATDTLHVGGASHPLHGSPGTDLASSTPVDTAWTVQGAYAAPEDESAISSPLYLWLDHPAALSSQDYLGALSFRLHATSTADASAAGTLPLRASVVNAGLASHVALAEVTPHSVVAGTHAQPFTVFLLPIPQATDTGIDGIRVSVPSGFGVPVVTQVRVAHAPVSFHDASSPGLVDVSLDTKVTTSQLIEVALTLDAPAALDENGSSLVVAYDDRSTAVSAQTATEGDANGVADGNSTLVRVVAGPLARLVIAPPHAEMFRDSSLAFSAQGQDSLGHAVADTLTWSVSGGIGSVAAGGSFTATTAGTGYVFARDGALFDSALVTVYPPRAIALLSVSGPALAHQGDAGVTLSLLLANRAPTTVSLDSLALHFGRARPDDADSDFTIAAAPESASIGTGETKRFDFRVDVALGALTGPLAVQAAASGVEQGSGIRLRAAAADTSLAWSVQAADLEITATQSTAAARPARSNQELLALHVHNRYPEPRQLQVLTLTNRTSGPGDREQLDGELGDVVCYADDGDGAFEADRDTLLLRTVALDGAVHFEPLHAFVPAGGDGVFFVAVTPPVGARDGDTLDLELAAPGDVQFAPAALYRNGWPVSAPGGRAIDGMVAAQVHVNAVGPGSLHPGSSDQLALDLVVPANGYTPDVLTAMGLVNLGTVTPTDLQQVRAWADDGDGVFSSTQDPSLGTFAYVGGGRWQLSGLSLNVPVGGRRVFVSVTPSSTTPANATVQLAVPAGDDPGLRVASGDTGPIDVAVANPAPLAVSNFDRVALAALAVSGGTARRGTKQVPLASLTVTNNYDSTRTLASLVLENQTSGPGTVADRDAEVRLLTLRLDGDGDGMLGDPSVDPVLATSYFQGGIAPFTGLKLALAPYAGRQLFVTADVAPDAARDGDAIGARVRDASGVDFAEPVTVSAAWPLDSGARWAVDGFTAAQVTGRSAPGATIAPGDGPLLALDLTLPRNGYSADVLRSLRVHELGTAGPSDLSAVQLWRDGGNGVFDPAGDDSLVASFVASGGDWVTPVLSTAISAPSVRLFVSITAAAGAAESTTVRFSLPVNGADMVSDDDGPLDQSIDNPEAILISHSPLLATLTMPRASVVGQVIPSTMIVRNTSSEIVRGVAPVAWQVTGSASYTLVSGPTPATFDLAPAQADTFTWQLRSGGSGDLQSVGAAQGTGDPSGLPRRAPRASSSVHHIFQAATALDLTPIQTMPVRVNRGQTNVVPFSLTLAHPGDESTSDVTIDRLRIRLVDDAGAAVVPSSVLDRVVVNEGTNVYAARTGLESTGSTVDLPFSTSSTVTATQPTTLSLRLDISDTTRVAAFRVIVEDSSAVSARDATSGAPVTLHVDGGTFPVRSDLTSVVDEATQLTVSALARDTTRVARGATSVPLASLRLENPGVSGISSGVRVTSMGLVLLDASGAAVPDPASFVSGLRLVSQGRVLAARNVAAGDPESLIVVFDPRLELAANTPLDLTVQVDVASAPFGAFGAKLLGPASVTTQDVNTRAAVPVAYQPDSIVGGLVRVEAPAESLATGFRAMLPQAVLIGGRGVPAMRLLLRHPGGPHAARVRLDGLHFECLDDARRPVVPASCLDHLVLRSGSAVLADRTSLPTSGSRIDVPLDSLYLEPGDTLALDVTVDVDAAAPSGYLELMIPADGILAFDANSGHTASLVPAANTVLPPVSGLGRLVSPSRELAVSLVSAMPVALAADGRPVNAGTVFVRNADPNGVGPIQLDHLVVQARDGAGTASALGAAATRIEAWRAGQLWARSGALTPDSVTATLVAGAPLSVAPGDTSALELRFVTRNGDIPASFSLGLDHPGIGVIQPSSALLAINVRPEPGLAFPMWTESGTISTADLPASYSNFPNPFAAGREGTTFVYYLKTSGRVSLRILTLRGEPVATLLDGMARPGGVQQADTWSGRNGAGRVVYNGVYVAELDVRFDDGSHARVLRKVAVVR
jgi:hypothetical protein